MKFGKAGAAAAGMTAAVMVFAAGHFLGGGQISGDYQVSVQQTAGETPSVSSPQETQQAQQPSFPVNINTADSDTLQALPGIGPRRATDIIAYRQANGPFRYPEDITRVPGIGEGILSAIAGYITVEEGSK